MFFFGSWVEKNLYISENIQINIIKTILIVIFMRIAYLLLKRLLYNFIESDRIYYKGKKATSFIITSLGILLVTRIWFEGVNSFVTFIGLFSAALALVMKDVILNVAGWIYILFRSPYKAGDRIEIGENLVGDVIDIQIFTTVIMEIRNWVYGDKYTGRIIHMPNYKIFKEPLFVFNGETDYIWNEFKIGLTLDSDWKTAKSLLYKIVEENTKDTIEEAEKKIKKAARMFILLDSDYSSRIYTSINYEEGNITFIVRYICHYLRKRSSADAIYEDILNVFANYKKITFAHPNRRIYYNNYKD